MLNAIAIWDIYFVCYPFLSFSPYLPPKMSSDAFSLAM